MLPRGIWGQGTALNGNWEEFGLFEFGVCLNEGQRTLHLKHREETEAPKCTVQLSCLVLSRGGSEGAGMSWVWPLEVVSLASAQRNLLSAFRCLKALLWYQTCYPVLHAMSDSSADTCAGFRNPARRCWAVRTVCIKRRSRVCRISP